MLFKRYLYILVLICLFYTTQTTVQIYFPQCAKDRHPVPIDYNLGNFGHIPYGKTIKGQLAIPLNSTLCDGTNEVAVNMQEFDKFLIVQRGKCKFTRKIIEAQKLNYKLVIVYDNVTSDRPNIEMANDGYGHQVQIPYIFISRSDGIKLIETMQKCPGGTVMLVKFDTFATQIADVTLWLDVDNRQSFVTLRQFYNTYYYDISSHIKLNLKFKSQYTCLSCQTTDCLSADKRTCYTQHKDHDINQKGKDILLEQLRSYYIHQMYKETQPTKWWKYMMSFDKSNCIGQKDMAECSEIVMRAEGVGYKQIYNRLELEQKNNYKILDEFAQSAKSHDILYYPEATINNRNFYGLFKATNLFEMICTSLKDPPYRCQGKPGPITDNPTKVKPWLIGIIAGVSTLIVFVVILTIYKKYMQKQMNQQLSVEVNRMVQQYVTLTETNSSGNNGLRNN